VSRVIPGIQGVPFRKVTDKKSNGRWHVLETLECGHTVDHLVEEWHPATKRRCYTCKWQADHPKPKAKKKVKLPTERISSDAAMVRYDADFKIAQRDGTPLFTFSGWLAEHPEIELLDEGF
jgi:hypothetical protein